MLLCALRRAYDGCVRVGGARAARSTPVATVCVAALMLSAPVSWAQAQEPSSTNGQTEPAADASGQELPEVVVETTPEPAAAPADPGPAPQASVAPQPVAPQPDVITSDEIAIFNAPNDGDTLNRGTSGVDGYFASGTSVATKTNTPIMDLPGQVTIITKELADDQGATWLGQALLYVPGVAVQQGEGHRDQVTFRGQETTADFFVDGVRDDIQTFRDLYNAETVEVLKGPLAMIFGRGGGGGVINRVTKKADGIPVYEGTFQTGMYERIRFTADVGEAITPDFAFRLNAMYENSETFRDFSDLERFGINPTAGFKLGDNTTLHVSYEYKVHDQNVDRGGPSIGDRPFKYPIEDFWGQPHVSFTEFDGHVATATFEHETDSGVQIRNHAYYADYYKLYQNIMPTGPVSGGTVELGGYKSITERQNFVNQTDVSYSFNQSSQIRHTVVAGTEIVFQDNFEFRNTPSFNAPNSGTGTIDTPISSPTIFNPVFFDQATRRRETNVRTLSVFVQDQMEITPYFELIGGIRFESFDVDFTDQLNDTSASRLDNEWSPRIGGVLKPTEYLHFYASYSKSFLPQNGDNFGSLSATSANLQPEEFENYEGGFKLQLAPRLLMQGAVYQLDRTNQRVTVDASTVAVGETRTRGAEIEVSGYVTDAWQVFGGYAYTDSEVLFAGNNATGLSRAGNSVETVPEHMFSMWNRYNFTRQWGVGLGVIHQSSWFPTVDNDVTVPSYTRVDAAIYYDHDETWSAQLNVENLFDDEYWISSHSDNNISYGAPISAYVTVKARW